jgi:hypothetical protein
MRKHESSLACLLERGDRRSIGRSNEVVNSVLEHPDRFRELIACLWSGDAVVRMRAADAAEKVSAQRPELLKPFKAELLGLLIETSEQELRWHLAQMIPRLHLNSAERLRASVTLRGFLNDHSSIVKTFSMQALANLAWNDARLRFEIRSLIEELVRTGTPAMKARGRKLLKRLR